MYVDIFTLLYNVSINIMRGAQELFLFISSPIPIGFTLPFFGFVGFTLPSIVSLLAGGSIVYFVTLWLWSAFKPI